MLYLSLLTISKLIYNLWCSAHLSFIWGSFTWG